MEKCVHRTWMHPPSAKVTPERKKWSEIELGLHFKIPYE
jgi:hypothetical protein